LFPELRLAAIGRLEGARTGTMKVVRLKIQNTWACCHGHVRKFLTKRGEGREKKGGVIGHMRAKSCRNANRLRNDLAVNASGKPRFGLHTNTQLKTKKESNMMHLNTNPLATIFSLVLLRR
jgi:hypothetical protein